MKISVYVATTQGPARIERITREAAPISQVCLRRTTTVLPISSSYDAFVRQPSGVVERALGPFEPGGFRLDASADIGDGESWQLPAFVAHALEREGRLAGPDDVPDAVLLLSGAVDIDLGVGEVAYVPEKLSAAQEMLAEFVASGIPVTLAVPEANESEVSRMGEPLTARVLGVRTALDVLREFGVESVNLPAERPDPTDRGLVLLNTSTTNLPRWRIIASVVSLLVFIGIGAVLVMSVPGEEPGSTIWDCAVCPEMVVIPAGTFRMGSDPGELHRDEDEGPPHDVTVAAFVIGRYEVTRGEFTAFVENTGYDAGDSCFVRDASGGRMDDGRSWRDPGYPQTIRDPVVCISWNAAQAFAAWLSATTGFTYRLPSEAEWEYAARAGTRSAFHVGDTITSEHANYNGTYRYGGSAKGEYRKRTLPVGSFAPNAFGLHDLHGNVWEWTEDCWNDSYRGAPENGSAWLGGNCGRRVMRGGAWSSHPRNLRSANRTRFVLEYRNFNFGFRVARSLDR